MNRCLALACALLFASLTVSSACFAGPVDPGVKPVPYDDLDLSSAGGMKALHRRIEAALNQVCLDPNGPSPSGTVDMACKIEGRRAAFAQIPGAIAEQQASRSLSGRRQAIAIANPQPEAATHR
jgi:UrcA family protein